MGASFTGLMRVGASRGSVELATSLDESRGDLRHRFPQFLPGGNRFLFFNITESEESTGIYTGSLDSEEMTFIFLSDSAGEFHAGHLLYVRDGALLARGFDPETASFTGEPRAIAHGLDVTLQGRGSFTASADVLAYATKTRSQVLVWTDLSGVELHAIELSRVRWLDVSRNESRIVFLAPGASGYQGLTLAEVRRLGNA